MIVIGIFSVSPNAGIQEGTHCTKCKNEWALKTSIALLYVLCTLLTIAVAVLGYKGTESRVLTPQHWWRSHCINADSAALFSGVSKRRK